jgi:hypothetical protein
MTVYYEVLKGMLRVDENFVNHIEKQPSWLCFVTLSFCDRFLYIFAKHIRDVDGEI